MLYCIHLMTLKINCQKAYYTKNDSSSWHMSTVYMLNHVRAYLESS